MFESRTHLGLSYTKRVSFTRNGRGVLFIDPHTITIVIGDSKDRQAPFTPELVRKDHFSLTTAQSDEAGIQLHQPTLFSTFAIPDYARFVTLSLNIRHATAPCLGLSDCCGLNMAR